MSDLMKDVKGKVIVGIQDATFTGKDGSIVVGCRLHIVEPMPEVSGHLKVSEVYMPRHTPVEFQLGPIQAVLYEATRSGKAIAVGVIK